jgi:bacteriorhodopsin
VADIDVVQKRSGSRAWIWLVLALIALAIILFMMMGPDATQTDNPVQPISAIPAATATGWMT